MTKVSCHCSLLSWILSVVKKYIYIFSLLINASEIQLFWRLAGFQNISTKAVVCLAFQINTLFLKTVFWKPQFTISSYFDWEVDGSVTILAVVFVLFCFLDYSISLHSVNYLWTGNSRQFIHWKLMYGFGHYTFISVFQIQL